MRKAILFITLLLFSGLVTGALAQDEMLSPGVAVSGSVEDSETELTYTIEGQIGETIYITVSPYGFGAEILLRGPNGAVMDNGYELNGMLFVGPLTLGVDGEYTLQVRMAEWETQGGDFAVFYDYATYDAMAMDVPIEGTFPDIGAARFLTLEAQAGDVVSVDARGLGMGFAIFDPRGALIYIDGFYDDPQLPILQLPDDGVYNIVLQTAAEGGTDYTFSINHIDAQPLEAGTPVAGVVRSSAPQVFSFDSPMGKIWSIGAEMEQADGQGYIAIYKPDSPNSGSDQIINDCCSGPNGTPRLDPFQTPEDGTYYVFIYFDDYSGTDPEVPFELTFNPASLFSLSPTIPVQGSITPESGNIVYTYNGTEGETVTIHVERLSENGQLGLSFVGAEMVLMAIEGFTFDDITFSLTLPLTLPYTIELYSLNSDGEPLDFSITLNP